MFSNRITSETYSNYGMIIDRNCHCGSTITSWDKIELNTFKNYGIFKTLGCSIKIFKNYGTFITNRCGLSGGCDDIAVGKFKNYGTLIIHDCNCLSDESQQIRTAHFENYGTIIRCHAECRSLSSVVITEIVDIPPATAPAILPPEASQLPKRSRFQENSGGSLG